MLDIEPTTVLSTDVGRAKINVRPAKKRPPTAAHLRSRQQTATGEFDDRDVNTSVETSATAEQTEAVSCHYYC